MGEEQGLSAERMPFIFTALIKKRQVPGMQTLGARGGVWFGASADEVRGAKVAEFLDEGWSIEILEVEPMSADCVAFIKSYAARAEGLQPPVGEVDGKVFSSLGASKAPSCVSAGVDETPSGVWQPMETAPRDGTSILIDDRHQGVVIGWWETGREFSGSAHFNDWCSGHNTAGGYDAGFERICQPLGWVPLPARQTSGGEA